MGFKRTSEGRVFFQGANTTANDENSAVRPGNAPQLQPQPLQAQQTQAQIIALLKTLNERLKVTQNDRAKMAQELEAYRALIEDLEKKTQRSERAYFELEKKISKGAGNGLENNRAEILAQEALNELKATRKMLLEVEDKAIRADQGLASLKSEVLEARKTENHLVNKQAALEKMTREQAEKLAQGVASYADLVRRVKDSEQKQEDLGAKVELATTEQARLVRKVDKAIEDRARFMRKIERIEETVIQTRDSLNAKAMVLLTDQNIAGQVDYGDEFNTELAALHSQANALGAEPLQSRAYPKAAPQGWSKSQRLQIMGLTGAVVLSVLLGWVISEVQKPDIDGFEAFTQIERAPDNAATSPATSSEASPETLPENSQELSGAEKPLDMASMDWSVESETSKPDEAADSLQALDPATAPINPDTDFSSAQDDIGALDLNNQEDVEKLLRSDMDSAAAALNAIEPSKLVAQVDAEPLEGRSDVGTQNPALRNPAELIKPDRNLPQTVKQIEDQAFAGVPEAQHDLAAIYTAGHGGVKQDYKRAAFWFEQASDRGIANAAYNLGVLHHQGLGTKADIQKAIDWYKRAASLGHPEAQYNLGIAHIEGIGVSYDPVKAAEYFRKAADQNIMEAAYNLGLIYENGLLGDAKPDEALVWYKIAADQGSPEAKQALEQLAKSLNIKTEDVNRLAESMKVIKKSENTKRSVAPPPPPAESSAVKKKAQATAPSQQVIAAQIQEYLMRVGLYPGPADGATSPLTEDAIRAYQKSHGLNADGLVTQGLLTHMLANADQ